MRFVVSIILTILALNVNAQNQLRVLASSSWTAAYARAAGIDNVVTLAPSTMLHPSEYELSIFDMRKITEADFVVYAGYERAIAQMKEMLIIDAEKYFKIETGYTKESVSKAIQKIAVRANTTDSAAVSIRRINELFDNADKEIESLGLKGKPVIVHFFQEPFIRELGMEPVAVIGPAPLEVYQIVDIAQMQEAVLIIDNIHNPIAQPLKEIMTGIAVVELVNFPGRNGTTSLESVIEYNLAQLKNAME
ncbi:MAG: metal ABC transporter substrate-binding protein [Prolixibacteraceae bacterium]|nr:metal ABC transporter substrate-binding protein [Prolixibacteraceae bacterium]